MPFEYFSKINVNFMACNMYVNARVLCTDKDFATNISEILSKFTLSVT